MENVDYASFWGNPGIWKLYIAGKARTMSEEYDEISEIIKTVFEAIEGFFIPTKIWYHLKVDSQDLPVYNLIANISMPSKSFEDEIVSDKGSLLLVYSVV